MRASHALALSICAVIASSLLTPPANAAVASYPADASWVVPSGVSVIEVSISGGNGGRFPGSGDVAAAPGGTGYKVTAGVSVAAGETVYIGLGANGADSPTATGGASAFGLASGGNGGTNGYGTGAGGGGASAVAVDDTIVMIAGGGGGAGSGSPDSPAPPPIVGRGGGFGSSLGGRGEDGTGADESPDGGGGALGNSATSTSPSDLGRTSSGGGGGGVGLTRYNVGGGGGGAGYYGGLGGGGGGSNIGKKASSGGGAGSLYTSTTRVPSTNYNSVGAALASPGAVINYIDFHTTSLPAARVDNAYSASLSATFGLSILPDAWDVSPALPTGLTLNSSTGAITGTPTTASSGTYTFTATSFAGASVISARSSIDLPLTVTADPALTPAFGSVTSTSDGFTVTVTNHDPAYTWATSSSTGTSTISGTGLVTVTGLSAGASATVTVTTTRTGYTTGTAQQTGTATAAATPSPPPTSPSNGSGDSSGSAQAQEINLASPHLRVIPPGMFTWAQGDSGSLTVVENSGGRAEFSIHPALPQGLSIEPSSGDLRGKPTGVVPPSQFVVTGRNSSGTSSVTITLHVTSANGGSAVAVRPADSVRFARNSTTLTNAMATRLDGLRQRLAAGPVTLTGVVPLSGRGTGVARKRAVQVRKYLRAEGVTVASLILLSKAPNPSMTRSVLFATQ